MQAPRSSSRLGQRGAPGSGKKATCGKRLQIQPRGRPIPCRAGPYGHETARSDTHMPTQLAGYTPQELMVVCAAREIRDGEVVFVGMRLPLLAFALAKRTHAPRAVGLFENGLVRDAPASALLLTMGDAPNILGAEWATRTVALMGLLAQGCANLGFVGGAEVDRYGNLNTSYIGPREHPQVKLPGSGGGAAIPSLAQRLAIIMAHDRNRFPERTTYTTGP